MLEEGGGGGATTTDRDDAGGPARLAALRAAFALIDVNRTGNLEADDLRLVCQTFGGVRSQTVNEILKEFGAFETGFISEPQWIRHLSRSFRDFDDQTFDEHLRYLHRLLSTSTGPSANA